MSIIKPNEINLKNEIFNENNENFVNYRKEKIDYKNESLLFLDALNNSQTEHDIQKYIKKDSKWFIPLSVIFNDYGIYNASGNYFYKELQLGKDYKADYAILGHNSSGYKLILIEFETPKKIKLLQDKKNEWTIDVRNGLTQIKDWERWFSNNKDYFLKSMHYEKENINLTASQIFYLLVISRRECFDERANNIRNEDYKNSNIKIVSYDRIVDNIAML